MLEAALLGLFNIAFEAIVGTQANDAAKHLCLKGIKKLSQDGKIVNHDLEKALKSSFLKAQQQIASECKQEIDPKNTDNRESFSYSLQHRRRDFDCLKRKLEKLKLDLQQVEKETVPSGIPIAGLDDIELLLTATDELKQNQVAAVKQKLLEVALENCDIAPYKTKLEQELFPLVAAYFAREIKENDKVFQIFTGQTLTRIDRTAQQMYAWLEEIVEKSRIVYQPIDWQAICQQILEEKEQQRLSSNQLTFGNHQIDDVYVPLGLVERQKVTHRREDVAAEEGLNFYRKKQITQGFEHKEFLEQVIQQGSSPKSNGKRLGIIGEPGAGKTTLLRQIANWVADEILEAIVIWVSLADLQGKELESYLFDNWLLAAIKRIGKAEATAEIKDDFLAQFNAERVWLVLDGADEMAVGDGNPLAEIERQIRTGGCIQKARIVLSCRQNVWDAIGSTLDTFDTYRTLEFSYPEQVEIFIDKWFGTPPNPPLVRRGTREEGEHRIENESLTPALARGAGGVLSQQLREALAASGKQRIRDLVKNPLRCSLLCGTWQSLDGDLPDTKAKLYQRFVTTLYQWKKPRLNWIQQQELNAALGKLALSGMLNETSRFQLRESAGYRVMGASQFELACHLGWLNLVARDGETLEGIYAFYHPTFQEYFAALAVEDWHFFLNHIPKNPQHPDARYRIFEKQWKEVILLWLGREEVGKDEKEAFIKALVKFKVGWDKFYGYRAYFLAAAGIAEFKDCRLADEIVSQIVIWGFGYFNKQKHDWRTFLDPIVEIAREVLEETDRKRAIFALVELIRNCGDEYTRREATRSLAGIGKNCPDAIAALVELINTSQDEVTRWQAADILGKIDKDSQVAIAALAELIHTSVEKNTWKRAAYSLGEIGKDSPEAIAALVELIRNSVENGFYPFFSRHNVPTCIIVAYSLVKIGKNNPVAIAALVELIRTSDNKVTQGRAAEILGRIDKDNPVAIETLLDSIRNYRPKDNRYQAAERLATIGQNNPVAIAALVDLIRTSRNKVTRWRAAECLGKIDKDNPVAISALVELSRNSNERTRWSAADSLGKIGKNNPVAIAALVELIRNSGAESTRCQAIKSLGAIGKNNPEAIFSLVELLGTSKSEYTRLQAAESLGKIDNNNPVTLSALVELLGTSYNMYLNLSELVNKLEKTGKNNPGTISALVELLGTSQNPYTGFIATECLGAIGKDNPVAIAGLVELIRNSGNEDIRCRLAECLGKIDKDNPVAIATLVDLIRNSANPDTRCRAASSLGKREKYHPVAIATLIELIPNYHPEYSIFDPADSLLEIMKGKHFAKAVSGLKNRLTSEIYKNDFGRNERCHGVIWNCAENMTYPDFYQAWHTQPTNYPTPNNHPQNTDIPTLLKQLQPTDKTFPVPLNIRALEGETDTSPIAQELCTQLYQAIFPADADIPAIRNAPEFKRLIPQLKNRLQKQHIALILHSCPCEDALSAFTRKLADNQMGIHIAWITDTPLELPLTGFAVDGDDLFDAVQNWIGRI
ncbi:putative signal transduction protein with Nacht domain [Oscillatoria nigro-viridis PCC 7112]|uniref:Putative signal transduction protein with Nacht domain n=1 Tax=Phormidium nigroviride PCC 7112 TaxID=179408 RepID=K9VIZ2_9CYAN|nr:HEAT repeat domain-containing protein [Oscillatoria nigro-viridis]AFZ07200.1 putative signal transduction protein with Nacht domain [Oscillatoria nigro-viridis PCC 7112]